MATLLDLGIPGTNGGVLHPKLKNKWRVTFANVGGGIDSQPMTMQAIKINKPKIKWEKVPLHRYNSTAYVAGKHTWEPLQLSIEDDISGTAASVIQAQAQKQQWLIGAEGQWLATAGEGSQYKFNLQLDTLDGNDTVIERWIYEGAWFENIDWGDLAYESSDAVVIELGISFDHARQSIGGYAGVGSAL